VKWLGLDDTEAYTLCGIAQKAQVIPEIKTLIDEGRLHVSNARRIVPIITPENQTQWLESDIRRGIYISWYWGGSHF